MVYDLIVIGGGPAGYLGAERAGHAGLKTLLIEKREVGGVCLNEGCIPSKTLLYSAKIYDSARYGEKYGIIPGKISFDHARVINRKNKTVKTLVAGVRAQLKKSNVDIMEGVGEIIGRSSEGEGYEVKVSKDGSSQVFTGKRLLVATGSVPVLPPIPGVKEGINKGFVLTNREILDLPEVPGSLVIVGGGVIGLEMASYFNSAGSKVTIIEMLDHIAGNTDREISGILLKNYEKRGIEFKLGAKVVGIEEGAVIYESVKGDEGSGAGAGAGAGARAGDNTGTGKVSVKADKVLMSIGRKPFVDGLGLDRIGVEVERGRVKVDEKGRTNVPGVYAAGDVNGYSMLAHTAYREAEVCINNILGKKDTMRYNAVPYVIYTNPEVAGVGETEETARQKGMEVDVAKVSMRYSGRYLAENEGGDGICKLLAEKKSGRLIGLHMIGNYSSEIIYGAAAMIEMEMKVRDIKEIVFPHPTVSEIIKEGIFQL
ncbi:MAG: dihydrolipoyl dehydrogenase [Clostridiaceae bacterium]|nr:dihydrolipoyl dehydrogenase [Clostridiaceae bacterium]